MKIKSTDILKSSRDAMQLAIIGKRVLSKKAIHKSKRVYDRKKFKKVKF